MRYTIESIEVDPIFGEEITIKLPDSQSITQEINVDRYK